MTQTPQDRVKLAYEAYSQLVLQAMVNYVEGDPRVDRMWVYTDMSYEAIETSPFFRFEARMVNHGEIGQLDSSREYDPWGLLDAIDMDVEQELVQACREAGAVPERIITVYNVDTGELDSQWDYEGVLQGEDDTHGRAMDRWIRSMGGQPIYAAE